MARISRIDELALIARCLAMDDRMAFGRLVDATHGQLRRFLYSLTGGDAALTDDIAQEAYLKAWTRLSGFRATSRFSTWVTAIAYNEYIDWMRRERPAVNLDDVPEDIAGSCEPWRAAEAAVDVERALTALAPVDRTIVLLFYVDDMSMKEIARVTGLTVTNVKTRLYRAKTRMAQKLNI